MKRFESFAKFLILLLIPAFWCFLYESKFLDRAQDWSVDLRYKFRGELPSPAKIVYVDIDAISLDPNEIGGWPWSRHYLAKVARTLVERAGVKAVGVDIVMSDSGFSESVDMKKLIDGNRELGRYLHSDPPVILAAAFTGKQFRDINGELAERYLPLVAQKLPPLEEIHAPELPNFLVGSPFPYHPAGVGLIDTYGGDTRIVPLYAPTNVRTYYHLAVEILRRYWDLDLANGVRVTDDFLEFVGADGNAVRQVPLRDKQLLEINWFSPWLSEQNPRISFKDVYAYAENLESDNPEAVSSAEAFFAQEAYFKDAIVLIGPVDPMLQDIAPTPFDKAPVPKVGVHGNLLKTMLSGNYLKRPTSWEVYGIIFGLTLVVSLLAVVSGMRSLLSRLAGVVILGGYIYLTFYWFEHLHWILPLIAPVGSALSTTLVAVGWQVIEEQKAKGRIKGMFGTYLAPSVVESMVNSGKNPELGGHDAEITPYFSDIQKFSSVSEMLTSQELGKLLNEYLTVCTDIVQEEGGTLDKYIGDAVVAMFGAPIDLPDHAYRACVASQKVQFALGELRQKWASEGDKWPSLVSSMRNRIGLNTGQCMIGNMGSRNRFNYTMMGDNVNLAARMESGAKSWGSFSMVAEPTRLECEKFGGDNVVFRPLGRIVVQGRSHPVPIHDIVGLKEHVNERTRECVGLFGEGLELYYARNWTEALKRFQLSAELEPLMPERDRGVSNNPSLVYQRIVAAMAKSPPPDDWDGIYVMTEK
jgi:adenylate cyclase